MFGFKEARGISNNTLSNASTGAEHTLTPSGSQAADVGNLSAQTAADIGNLSAQTAADIGNLSAQTAADISNLSAQTAADIGNLSANSQAAFANLSLEAFRTGLCLYGNCPTENDPFSISNNVSLFVDIFPKEIQENTPSVVDVRGQLFSPQIGGPKELNITLSDGRKELLVQPISTDDTGKFHLIYNDAVAAKLVLSKGHYSFSVIPTDKVFSGLNATRYIDVTAAPITWEQLLAIAVAITSFFGAIVYLPKLWLKKKELKMLADIFTEVDNTYSQNKSDAHKVEGQLENLRKRYLVLLGKGKLDQNTFDLVERRIIYLISKDKST